MTSLVRAGRRRRSNGSAAPASLPPAGLPGLVPSWSRLVEVTDGGGVTRTFHVLDSRAPGGPAAGAVIDEAVAGAEPFGTLLCVHGNPTWGYLWRGLLAAAPPGWRVVAPDQLGMGYSERIDGTRVLAQRVDDLGRLTDALGITGADRTGPVVTVAHDWGGVISLGWAAEHREQLRGVVLTNTAVHQPDTSPGPLLIRLAHRPLVNRVAVRWTPLFVRATASLTWPRPPRPVRDAFAAPYRTVSGRRAVGQFVADIPFAAGHPSRPALDRIADGVASLGVPGLLLWGPRDPIFGEEHLRDLQQRLPSAGLHRYERASHLLPEDAPGYVDAVRAFVAQLPGRGSAAASTPEVSTGRHRRVESTPLAADPAAGDSAADRPAADHPAADRPTADRPTALAELAAHATDDDPAVVEVGGRSISWADLHARVRDTAAGLTAAGVARGDRVALLVPPSIELTVALYAVWQAGGVIVVVDKGLGLRGMGRALRSARVDHLVADTAGLLAAGPMRVPGTRIAAREISTGLARIAGVRYTLPALAAVGRATPNPVGSGPVGSGSVGSGPVGSGPAAGGGDPSRDTDEAAVIFTSGATGPAKGVLYRHGQVRAQLALIRATYRISGADRIVAAFAPFALYGPALGVPSAVPATDVTRPGTLTSAALGDAAVAIDATVVFASPAALANVIATADGQTDAHRAALGRVRLLMSAGAPVPADLLRRLAAVLPNAELHTPYGMTEGLPLTDITLPEIERAGAGDGVCVGRPLPGVDLLIGPLDGIGVASTELTAEPGVSGEIWSHAEHLKDRYDSRWVLDQAAASHPGWHRTGDVGMLDDRGRLWVQGRTQHVVSTADGPVTPVGIEQRVASRLSTGAGGFGADDASQDGHASGNDDGAGTGEFGATGGGPDVAVVGVGPVGTQQVVVVLTGAGGPLASPALTAAARVAAGRPVAAVLVRPSLPVDIRHNSKVDRVAVGRWASALLAGGRAP